MSCEIWEFGEKIERVARKTHKCCECKHPIVKGEKYEYVSGFWRASGFRHFKTCMCCAKARCAISSDLPYDECVVFGELMDYLKEMENDIDLEAVVTSVSKGAAGN